MYEHKTSPPLTLRAFSRRMFMHGLVVFGLIMVVLGVGVAGYMGFAGLAWDDAILNASMILGGMGPVAELHSTAAKLFASGYALFSGVVFIAAAGILLAPLGHHILHRFHWETSSGDAE
jgi:hypothetical protein